VDVVALVGHAVVGTLAEHLWHRRPPTPADVDHVTAFCLRAATPGDLRSPGDRAMVQAMVSDVKNDVVAGEGGA
jgi:hypothetical protein